jgi:hypothetical protein
MGEVLLSLKGSMASTLWGNKTKLKSVEFMGLIQRHTARRSAAEDVQVAEEVALAEFVSGRSSIAVVGGGWG